MKFINAEQVHTTLEYPALIQGLNEYHRGDTQVMDDMLLAQSLDEQTINHLLARAAWQYDQAVGVKLATIFPRNPEMQKPLPAVQAVYVLFDGINGSPLAAVDGTALTYRKTAADSAVGASYLARDTVSSMLMVGAGGMAPHLIAAHCAARPSITSVHIWNRTPSRAERVASDIHLEGVSVDCVQDLEPSVRQADLISCATMSKQPLVKGAWLKPGAHLDLVGAFTPDMREADDEAVDVGTLFVDSRQTTIDEIGELIIPIRNGTISESDVVADLYDLCRGKHPGRTSDSEITVFKNGGGGHLDLMTTRFLLSRLEPGDG